MRQRIGLYYPYVYFQDEGWLTVAALYWPKMSRIVPPGFDLADSDLVRTLADELDFVVNIEPGPAAGELSELMALALWGHERRLQEKYGLRGTPSSEGNMNTTAPPPPLSHSRARLLNSKVAAEMARLHGSPFRSGYGYPRPDLESSAPLAGLHSSKGTAHVWAMLEEYKLAVRDGDSWVLNQELAWIYSCALADRLASRNSLIPTTGRTAAYAESTRWTDDYFMAAVRGHAPPSGNQYRGDLDGIIGELALRLVVPADPDGTPIKKIITARQRYGADFDAFYDEVAAVASDLKGKLGEIDDSNALTAYLNNEVEIRFQRPIRELRKAMRGLGVETAYSALTTKFELPASAALFAGLLSGNTIVTLSGSLAFGAAALFRGYVNSRSKQMQPSAASYLWHIDHTVNPRGILESVRLWGNSDAQLP